MYIPFCTVATLTVYKQGTLNGMNWVGMLILIAPFLFVGIAIRAYIKSNSETIKKWFHE